MTTSSHKIPAIIVIGSPGSGASETVEGWRSAYDLRHRGQPGGRRFPVQGAGKSGVVEKGPVIATYTLRTGSLRNPEIDIVLVPGETLGLRTDSRSRRLARTLDRKLDVVFRDRRRPLQLGGVVVTMCPPAPPPGAGPRPGYLQGSAVVELQRRGAAVPPDLVSFESMLLCVKGFIERKAGKHAGPGQEISIALQIGFADQACFGRDSDEVQLALDTYGGLVRGLYRALDVGSSLVLSGVGSRANKARFNDLDRCTRDVFIAACRVIDRVFSGSETFVYTQCSLSSGLAPLPSSHQGVGLLQQCGRIGERWVVEQRSEARRERRRSAAGLALCVFGVAAGLTLGIGWSSPSLLPAKLDSAACRTLSRMDTGRCECLAVLAEDEPVRIGLTDGLALVVPHLETCGDSTLEDDVDPALAASFVRYSLGVGLADPDRLDVATLRALPDVGGFLGSLASRLPPEEVSLVRLVSCGLESDGERCDEAPTPGRVAVELVEAGRVEFSEAVSVLERAETLKGCADAQRVARDRDHVSDWLQVASACEAPAVWPVLSPGLRDQVRVECPPLGARGGERTIEGEPTTAEPGLLLAVMPFPEPDALTVGNLASLSTTEADFERYLALAESMAADDDAAVGVRGWRRGLAPGLDAQRRQQLAEELVGDPSLRRAMLAVTKRSTWYWHASTGIHKVVRGHARGLWLDAAGATDLACTWAPPMAVDDLTLALLDSQDAYVQRAELAEWAAYLSAPTWAADDQRFLACLASARVTIFRRDRDNLDVLLETLERLEQQPEHATFANAAICALLAEHPDETGLPAFLDVLDELALAAPEQAATCLSVAVLTRSRLGGERVSEARTLLQRRPDGLDPLENTEEATAALERAVSFMEQRAVAGNDELILAADPLEVADIVRALRQTFSDPESVRVSERFGDDLR